MAAHEILAATNAVVTLDVALPGVVWPWLVTVNMWAKSIGTGVIFMLFLLLKRYPNQVGELRFPTVVVSIVFIHIFLLFTLADLHQPFRMWHIFFYPHVTSAITVGAWMATAFVGLLFLLAFQSFVNSNNVNEISSFTIDDIRSAINYLGQRDTNAGFRLAMQDRIKDLELINQRQHESKIRAWNLVVGLLVGILIGIIVAKLT